MLLTLSEVMARKEHPSIFVKLNGLDDHIPHEHNSTFLHSECRIEYSF